MSTRIVLYLIFTFFTAPVCYGEYEKITKNRTPVKAEMDRSGPTDEEMKAFPQQYGNYKEFSLDDVVFEFNNRAVRDSIGKTQPLLTVQEVLTSIRSWSIDAEPTDLSIFREFQKIAQSSRVPKGAYLDFSKGVKNSNGFDSDFWIIELYVGLHLNTEMGAEKRRFSRVIRIQYLSSKPHHALKARP